MDALVWAPQVNYLTIGDKEDWSLKKLNSELFKSSELSFLSSSNLEISFGLKKLISELLNIKKLVLAYLLMSAKGFDILDEFLVSKSICKPKMRKFKRCHLNAIFFIFWEKI